MKYYSRNPQELQEQMNQKPCKTDRAKRMSKLILFANLIIILLVFGVVHIHLQNQNQEIPISEQRSVFWEGWKISSACNYKKGCDIILTPQKKTVAHIKTVQWNVSELTKTKEETTIPKLTSGIFNCKKNTENIFFIPPEFSKNASIGISINSAKSQPSLELSIYP